MEVFVAVIAPLLLPLFFYVLLSVWGIVLERRLEARLDEREAAVAGFYLSDLRTDPTLASASAGEFVGGSVVMGTGYLKQFTAGFRTLVGGEVKGYQRVLHNGRREAQLRMIEAAKQRGATGVINVRFETSNVGFGRQAVSEIFCYGTLIR